MTGVYQIVCLKNNRKYIGMSKDIDKRWLQHKYQLKTKKHHSVKLQEDYDKYGENSFRFSVIKECHYLEARTLEASLIDMEQPYYNLIGTKHCYSECCDVRSKIFETKVLEFVKVYRSESFDSGDTYLLSDIFYFSRYINSLPTEILKYAGIDKERQINDFCRLNVDNSVCLGVITTDDGLYVAIAKDGKNANYELIGGAA